MTLIHSFLEDVQDRFQRDSEAIFSVELGDIRQYFGDEARTETSFFNDVGMQLALSYVSKAWSFEFCDRVANGLWNALLEIQSRDTPPPWPDLFYDVFLAFDFGEYQHAGDDVAIDPVKAYTDPYIAWILSNYLTADQPSPVRRTDPFYARR